MFGFNFIKYKKLHILSENCEDFILPKELNRGILFDYKEKLNKDFVDEISNQVVILQKYFKKYYDLKSKLYEIKLSQEKSKLFENYDIKDLEKSFEALCIEKNKFLTEVSVFDSKFENFIISTLTPTYIRKNSNEK